MNVTSPNPASDIHRVLRGRKVIEADDKKQLSDLQKKWDGYAKRAARYSWDQIAQDWADLRLKAQADQNAAEQLEQYPDKIAFRRGRVMARKELRVEVRRFFDSEVKPFLKPVFERAAKIAEAELQRIGEREQADAETVGVQWRPSFTYLSLQSSINNLWRFINDQSLMLPQSPESILAKLIEAQNAKN